MVSLSSRIFFYNLTTMNRLIGGIGASTRALAPVHFPMAIASALFNAVPLVVILYGFWDEYSDFLQSQSLKGYQGNVEQFDFIIGTFYDNQT